MQEAEGRYLSFPTNPVLTTSHIFEEHTFRYKTQILMLDPVFKLTEVVYIMVLSECKYLMQTFSRRWNHIDPVLLIFTTLSFF